MNLDLARWQFAIITVYHFLFVPLTIGLSLLVAGMQTAWVRTSDGRYLRMTKFWGKLFLINFAMGVVTGIVQEFQFGMNWSDYSRFVGDIFGAPLAIEGLLAFFLESTFLGLWIFGWDRLPKGLHLACIWMASIGTMLSAYFILAANSWMQHPVGSVVNDAAGRAELKDFGAVLTNSTAIGAFTHTITAAFVTAGVFVMAISAYHLARGQHIDVMRPSIRLALVTVLVASVGVVISGDVQAGLMTEQQPMKMAAAEALYDTVAPASFSLFTIGSLDGSAEIWSVRVPRVLSFMATGSFDGKVEGINDLQAASEQKFGPGDYKPNIPVTYWTFRLMIGFGALAALLSVIGLWLTRRRARRPVPRWFYLAALVAMVLPFAANSVGWIFTEMGRQPWVVFGTLRTADGVSPGVGATTVLISLIVLTLVYGVLAVIDGVLMVRYAKAGPRTSTRASPPAPTSPGRWPWPTERAIEMALTDVWFLLIAVLWTGYFVLEGFDFGVGMLLPLVGRTETDRRVAINTIGPVWDGNEVWLLVAGGATFAAFPEWYASLFSGFYLALLLILVALIGRGVAFEFRGKIDSDRWRRNWDRVIVVGSLVPALLWGVAFANIVQGVPLDADHEYTGTLFTLLNPYALLGGLATVLLFALHGAVFLALKTTGSVRQASAELAKRAGLLAVPVGGGFLVWTQLAHGAGWTWVPVLAAAAALVAALAMTWRTREGWAFVLTTAAIVAVTVTLFGSLYPDVLPSSTSPANSLTTTNASSTPYTLTIMTWVAVVFTPIVLAYQAWTFWVFRRRIGASDIPAPAGLPARSAG